MFDHLVDLIEPICQKLNLALPDMTIFDTSGIEAWVTENNPKHANRIIKQLKAFKKPHNLDDSCDFYKAAYGSMPTHAASNHAIQQMYINWHFCYAVCPKIRWEYNPADKLKHQVCHCDKPCTTSSCGRMIYIYPEKIFVPTPGVERDSKGWEDTYKIRVNVEKSINCFKNSFCTCRFTSFREHTACYCTCC